MKKTILEKIIKKKNGATAVEYGLIIALISIAVMIALNLIGVSLTNIFDSTSEDINHVGDQKNNP